MKTIWKFRIPLDVGEYGPFDLLLPRGANPLHADVDESGAEWVWAFIPDTAERAVPHSFCRAGTGKQIPTGKFGRYLSTYSDGRGYVWHIFAEAAQ